MNIDKLEIKNFKAFTNEVFTFHKKFNLIIGENGSGKTSILRAAAIALGGWAHAYIKNARNLRPIEDDEIREVQLNGRFDKAKSTTIKATGSAKIVDRGGEIKNGFAIWSKTRFEGTLQTVLQGNIQYGSFPRMYNLNFDFLGSDILSYIEGDNEFDLPIIAFYECNRLWLPENKLNIESSAKAKYSRFDPYVDCFHTGADHQAVGEWILKHELASFQQKNETPVMTSIKSAAIAALEDCIGLQFDFEQGRIILNFENNISIPFEHLSDGQRTMLGVFCDIARRAAILNPHMEAEANQRTKGVVLIDELDLHLHPKWQRKIIENLQTCFPCIQFICTTHSPFLIQSLRDGKLIQLDKELKTGYVNASIEDIAEDIQGVDLPQKSARYLDMMSAAEKYYRALHEAADQIQDIEQLKIAFEALTIPYSDDPAFSAQLKLEREYILNLKGMDDEASN